MIDWTKERAFYKDNYCGYCIDFTCPCNGSCFLNDDEAKKHFLKKSIKITTERLKDLRAESKKLKEKK